jgi:hypothetical protein
MGLLKYHILTCEAYFLTGQLLRSKVSAIRVGIRYFSSNYALFLDGGLAVAVNFSLFMRWLTLTHTQRWHAKHHTQGTGPLYQGRFKAFPVAKDERCLRVLRYVEGNPLRAGLARSARRWRWSSLARATLALPGPPVATGPVAKPEPWQEWVDFLPPPYVPIVIAGTLLGVVPNRRVSDVWFTWIVQGSVLVIGV